MLGAPWRGGNVIIGASGARGPVEGGQRRNTRNYDELLELVGIWESGRTTIWGKSGRMTTSWENSKNLGRQSGTTGDYW